MSYLIAGNVANNAKVSSIFATMLEFLECNLFLIAAVSLNIASKNIAFWNISAALRSYDMWTWPNVVFF